MPSHNYSGGKAQAVCSILGSWRAHPGQHGLHVAVSGRWCEPPNLLAILKQDQCRNLVIGGLGGNLHAGACTISVKRCTRAHGKAEPTGACQLALHNRSTDSTGRIAHTLPHTLPHASHRLKHTETNRASREIILPQATVNVASYPREDCTGMKQAMLHIEP